MKLVPVVGCILAFGALVPNVSFAAKGQQNGQTNNQMNNQQSAQSSAEHRVSEHFVRDVGNNCQYVANVTGSITDTGTNAGQREFMPNLAIDARVNCPNSQGEHLSVRTLSGTQLTETALQQAIAQRASVIAMNNGRLCTYTPTFALNNDQIRGQSVNQSCQPAAVGGGPSR